MNAALTHVIRRCVLPGTFAMLLLTSCGGGQDLAPVAAVNDAPQAKALAVGPVAAVASASVSALTKVSEKRISRTLFEYEFRITVQNGAAAQNALSAQLIGAAAGTTVVQGGVLVGDLAANASVTPAGTITLRQDRLQPFQPSQLIWTFSASTATPTAINLTLNQTVVGAGASLEIQAVVTDANGKAIEPPPVLTYQLLLPPQGTLGATPTVSGKQLLTSTDTRGGFGLQATLGNLVARADFVVVASTAQSANSGQFANLAGNQARLIANLELLRDAVARGDSAAVATYKAAVADAGGQIDPVPLYFGSPYAPDAGFIPEPAKLVSAGLVPSANDATHASLVAQLQTKLGQITALLRATGGSEAANTALLGQYLSDLGNIASQLKAPGAQPSAHALVANATHLNRLITQDMPIAMRALADRTVAQVSASVASVPNPTANMPVALAIKAASITTRTADGLPASQALVAWTLGGSDSPTFLLSGLLNAMGPIGKLIDGMYGQAMSQIQNMLTLLIAKDLLDKFLAQSLIIEGVHSGAALLGPYAYNYPDSTIELTNTSAGEMVGADAYLIGASAVNALRQLGGSLEPPKNAKSFKEIYDYFKGVLDAIKGVGEAYELAHQLPAQIVNNSFSENFGCLVSLSDNCVEMQYPSGFKNVAGGERFSFTVLILVRSGGPKPKYGSFITNFVPTT